MKTSIEKTVQTLAEELREMEVADESLTEFFKRKNMKWKSATMN